MLLPETTVSFDLLLLLHVEVMYLIKIGKIVLAFSCFVIPNYPILVFYPFFFSSSFFF